MTSGEADLLRDIGEVKRDLGEMKADIRTIRHDHNNLQLTITAINARLNTMNGAHQRGLGFMAGVAFIITGAGGMLAAIWKLVSSAHGS